MPSPAGHNESLLLSRAKVCQMLGITGREFYALVEAKKLHPIHTRQRHIRVPRAEVMALKSEYAHRALNLPYDKFIKAATYFTTNAVEINDLLAKLHYPPAPVDYIERCRLAATGDQKQELIREKSYGEFVAALGRAQEILKRDDLRLMVELLVMIQKTEKEIRDVVKAKYGREYGEADVLRFIEYFWNWHLMDPDSVKFYMEYIQGREKILKTCAYERADYFIYYHLGLDFGAEIPELLEKSCLGMIHKLNVLVDGYAFGTMAVSLKDLSSVTEIIVNVLGAAQGMRNGKVPKGRQPEVLDKMIPAAVNRTKFFEAEGATSFKVN